MVDAITVSGLSKTYQGRRVVDDISFAVAPGTVTGLLGANGAGKSTTLRMMLGLTRPTSGEVWFDGRRYGALPNPGRLVGAMLDAQANHRGRTGQEILRLHAATLGLRRFRAEPVLEQVGLLDARAKPFGRYSLGMKQRLGLACALVGDPRILMLDEPANGLDPQGILWIRDFLRDFADRGGAVLLSSHLLREVELLADGVLVVVEGRKVADLSRADMAELGVVRVAAQDPEALRRALTGSGWTFETTSDGVCHVRAAVDDVGLLAAREGIALRELGQSQQSPLESLFFHLSEQGAHREHLATA